MPENPAPLTIAPERLAELRRRRRARTRRRRLVAVVGLACRFPGAPNPRRFWKQLEAGAHAVTEGRPRRGNAGPEEPLWGGYLEDLDRFDPAFFRIAPVEAELMDPQQRLLLEVSWEALEDAGIAASGLRGSRAGVYVGVSNNEYRLLMKEPSLYAASGNSIASAIGRIAFTLGLNGPAITVDTACSSSLVAIHLAIAALQRGEADLALGGGVNVILSGQLHPAFERAGMLAGDGRCKTFDAAADGFVRSEGCGILVLKRLADAERDGDRILGVLLGSAVNQDGASAGLTVPNGPAQERVIREALERAEVAPFEVDYLEAHGTGTELGDPIEVGAAAAVYGEGRDPERPLLTGSVKTNIGHLESAAGVAGVIKTLLAMRYGLIPRHLHLERLNPRIDWDRLPVRVTSDSAPWPAGRDRPVRAGVSSFGLSGTNAHLILEAWGDPGEGTGAPLLAPLPGKAAAVPDARRYRVLPLSGASRPALSELAGRYREWMDADGGEPSWDRLSDASWTAGVGRSHFGARAAVVFSKAAELRERLFELESAAAGAVGAAGRIAFLFTGQGSQWAGMGRDLYEREPVFRGVLERAEEVIREERDASLLGVMFGDSGQLDATQWTQPALYALQGALVALWRSVGIEPAAVLGHSVGEIAAAHAAGVFGFEAGLLLAARRGALMGALPGGGGMVAVFAPVEDLTSRLTGELALAADNGTHQVVSGPRNEVEGLQAELGAAGIRFEPLNTSHAFHSPLMEGALRAIGKAASDAGPKAPSVPLVTNVTGRVAGAGDLVEGAYWRRQARSPVRFAAGVRTLFDLDCGVLIEIGPRGVLGPLAALQWPEGTPLVVSSLEGSRTADDLGFAQALGRVYEAGPGVAFAGLFAGEARRRVEVPTYPFQRQRYWVKGRGRAGAGSGHPLLGVRRDLPDGEVSFEISTLDLDWLGEQRLFGRTVLPGSGYAVGALAALGGGAAAAGFVADLGIERPLVLPEVPPGPDAGPDDSAVERTVQFVLGREEAGGAQRFEVFSREAGDGPWIRHAAGWAGLETLGGIPRLSPAELDGLKAGLSPLAADEVYRRLRAAGLEHGPSFRGLDRVWSGARAALAELRIPEGPGQDVNVARLVLLESCLQVLGAMESAGDGEGTGAWVPVGWKRLRIWDTFPERVVCHAALRAGAAPANREADLRFYAPDGSALGELTGLRLRPASRSSLLAASAGTPELLYGLEWRSADPPDAESPGPGNAASPEPGALLLWPGEASAGAAAELVAELERRGQRVIPLDAGPDGETSRAVGDPLSRESWRALFTGLGGDSAVRGVLHAGALAGRGNEEADPADGALELSLTGLAVVQGLRDAEIGLPLGISFLTAGAQVVSGEGAGRLEGSPLWGFARAARREITEVPVRLLDLDPGNGTPAAALAEEVLCPGPENEIAWRGGRRLVPRVVRLATNSGEPKGDTVRGDRSYLVTGAFGGLGLRVGGWLAQMGAGAVILSGRREPGTPARDAEEGIRARGTEVRLEVADVTDAAALRGLVSGVAESGLPPLGGVIHCAGVLADRSLPNQDRDSFERVFAPKVLGGWNLHRATLDAELDFFVLFSSFSGLAGTPGQANYAAANAFLDQLARWRRARDLPGQAIAWGAWSEVGAAAAARRQLGKRIAVSPAGWIAPEQALDALDRLLRDGVETSAVAPVDWEIEGAGGLPPLFEEFAPDPAAGVAPPERGLPDWGTMGPGDGEAWLREFLREQVRVVLRLSAAPPPDVGFFELGMDSLTAVELRNRVNRAFSGLAAVENTVAFDYPDINRLARHLFARLGPVPEPSGPAAIREPRAAEEPIAIVGMAGRFPGANDVRSLWSRLAAGDDLITAGRTDGSWVNGAEAAPTPGGYVEGLDRFDAAFFRIPPVEAELMDPQQRLLLETSWEALEDAVMDPERLRGTRVGVYAGITNRDYERLLPFSEDDPVRSLYLATGNTFAAAIGRISFALGFQGPAIAVDTACSSSLVAIHQAVAGLVRREADLALAGGVNAILLPEITRALAGGMLAPDGRCKTFDAAADGYGRGEGCGMLVLKRLADAERDGDRVLAVVLGSAVNQDGASAGLTVPNGPAQEAVIREAVSRAGVAPSSVDYLEAHGTGTELGDPIEAGAAATVYGEGRDADHPLLIGSVKTNIGHLESAAGVAGVIKVVLAMRHRAIPEHLHFERPNPGLAWDRLPLRVTKELVRWPELPDRPMRAGVSSFGFSGTNAHLVLEAYEPPEDRPLVTVSSGMPEPEPPASRSVRLLPLSGKTGEALSELAARYLDWLAEGAGDWDVLSDAAFSAGVGRSHFGVRAGLVFGDAGELRERLAELRSGADRGPCPSDADAAAAAGKTAFLFTGQGSQWAGMGRDLYESEPAARAVLDRADAIVREERGTGLLPVMLGEAEDLNATEWTQPALFALAAALVELWRGVGIEPDLVLGHSVGEVAAAHAAGVFGFEDGMRFALHRGVLMGSLPRDGGAAGGMLAVFAPETGVQAAVAEVNAGARGVALGLAADNGTHQVVSGPVKLLEVLEDHLARAGVPSDRLRTSHAFHSGLMDSVLAELEEAARRLESSPPAVPLVADVTGRVADPGEVEDTSYWRRQARSPVRFAKAVRTLSEAGCRFLIEIGPRAVLGPLATLCWPESASGRPHVLTSVDSEGGVDGPAFLRGVARAYEAGLPVRFEGLFAGERRGRVSLPSYPFARERHWVRGSAGAARDVGDPLLGVRRELPSGEVSFESDTKDLGWAAEHRVFGRAVAPAAFHAAQALEALRLAGGSGTASTVSEMRFALPLVLGAPGGEADAPGRVVQLLLGRPEEGGERPFDIFSRGPDDADWVRHAAGRVRFEDALEAGGLSPPGLSALKSRMAPIEPRELYGRLGSTGLEHGIPLRGVARLWAGAAEALGELRLPEGVEPAAVQTVMLDACLQVLGGVGLREARDEAWLPVGWERLSLGRTLPGRAWCHVRVRESGTESGTAGERRADLKLYADDGVFLGQLEGLALNRTSRPVPATAGLLYRIAWRELPGRRPADFLPGPDSVVASARETVDRVQRRGLTLDRMPGLDAGLEDLAAGYALRALVELGWERRPETVDRPEELAGRFGVLPAFRRLFGRLFALLAGAGVAAGAGQDPDFSIEAGPEDPLPEALRDPDGLAAELLGRHPEGELEVRLLRRSGAALAEVLTGRAHALGVLNAEAPTLFDVSRDSPGQNAALECMVEAVAALARALPAGERLRVLEVGAGAGAATAELLKALPAGRADYTVTDLLDTWFEDMKASLGGEEAGVRYRLLDLERDPVGQGFEPHGFDLVLSSNSLHPTRNLAESLGNMRRVLAPSGVVVVLEGMGGRGWMDLTFGLLEAWWRFDDGYRANQGLAEPEAWRRAFSDAGYADVRFLTAGDAGSFEPDAARIGPTVQGVMVARGPAEPRPDPGVWVIGAEGGRTGAAAGLVAELEDLGQRVVVTPATGERRRTRPSAARPRPLGRKAWRKLFRSVPDGLPLQGVLLACGLEGSAEEPSPPALAARVSWMAASAEALGQAIAEAGAFPRLGVCLVTRGGQGTNGESGPDPAGAVLWGYGRSLRQERPELRVRLLDLNPAAEGTDGLAEELLHPAREPDVALRGTERLVPRLVRLPVSDAAAQGLVARKNRSHLVTGGFDGPGLQVAGWLADGGAEAIVLVVDPASRDTVAEAVEALRERGAEVLVTVCDLADGAALDRLLLEIGNSGLPPLGGVFHAAFEGPAPADGARDGLREALAPRVVEAWQLHRATRDLPLDRFVLLSAGAGVVPDPGQVASASASAFLDRLAHWRRARGLPGQAIAWGAWSDGASWRPGASAREATTPGTGSLTAEQGAASFDRLVREDVGSALVTAAEWGAAHPAASSPLLEELVVHGVEPGRGGGGELTARLRAAASGDHKAVLAEFLQEQVQGLLGLASPPTADIGFFELGMNSLLAVELRNRVQREVAGEARVPDTVVLDHPSIARLTDFLARQFGGAVEAASPIPKMARPGDEAIAVIGMNCRLPGGADPAAFWSQLEAGADLVTDGRPDGLMAGAADLDLAYGGYVGGMDLFDAEFFRIAPVEAELMDPQQRVLLETSWSALEDAGLDPAALRGTRTAVYAGIMNADYAQILQTVDRDPARGVYLATGAGSAAAIGRVSFAFGFRGPAVAVDTACSSSLVAIHQAASGLFRGEADLALAGGVNAILTATTTRVCMEAGMLSPNGRCRTFDAAADGFVRAEGCGMLVLKRLSDAERDGDRILGVLLGSAVNQDGASAGFTVPNGPAQEDVIREALSRAGIAPSSVDYLECHGTGTELGDPIEVQAAAAVYGDGREARRPLLIGSVKANVGHLESAAGVAGVIKVLLAMREGVIPRQVHFDNPNPRIDWERLPVRVAAETTAWPAVANRPFRAGVSSFGYSGTNAHLVLEGYGPPGEAWGAPLPVVSGNTLPAGTALEPRRYRLLPLSGRNPEALAELAGRYRGWLDGAPPEGLADAAWTAGAGRSHFRERAGLVFAEPAELREQLDAVASGGRGSEAGRAPVPGKVAFLFTGQGSQWAGMGRDLYEREPVARAVLDRAEAVIREERGHSLLEVMFEPGPQLVLTEWTQPALFALQGALLALWESLGIEPRAVFGHSVGEIAAASAAGVFGFEPGLRFAARRGELMGSLPREGENAGGMLAVFASGEEVASALSHPTAGTAGSGLELAADNGAHQVVSGCVGALVELEERFRNDGVRTERLDTGHAFHSFQMEPVLDALEQAASALAPGAPRIPLVSGETGRLAGPGVLREPGYWRRQARAAVRFADGIRTLAEDGVRVLVEIGPRGVLAPMAALAWPEMEGRSGGPRIIPSQTGSGASGDASFVRAVAEAYEAGLPVSFAGLFAGESRRRASVPGYPFQRRRHWAKARRRAAADGHPLLGRRHALASGEVTFETVFSSSSPAWLADHRVFDRVVAPGALFAALALQAARTTGCRGVLSLSDFRIERPLVLADEGSPTGPDSRTVQLVLRNARAAGSRTFEVFSRGEEREGWVRHATGQVAAGSLPDSGGSALDLERLRGELPEIAVDDFYRRLQDAGLRYGPVFRGVVGLRGGRREALAELARPEGPGWGQGVVHPALLDACLHALGGVELLGGETGGASWLPVGWERLWLADPLPDRLFSFAELREGAAPDGSPRTVLKADFSLHAEDTTPVGGVSGLELRPASRTALLAASASVEDLLYEVSWRDSARAGARAFRSAAFLAAPGAVLQHAEARSRDLAGERTPEMETGLERLARAETVAAFDALGWKRRRGTRFQPEALRRRLKVVEQHRRLFVRLLAMLAEAGVVRAGKGDSAWTVVLGSSDPLPDSLREPAALAERLLARHPGVAAEISLLRRCGAELAEALRGGPTSWISSSGVRPESRRSTGSRRRTGR